MFREEFPILETTVHGRPLVYLDNAATTQISRVVEACMREQWFTSNANVHRGMHALSVQSTKALEDARRTVGQFIGAANPEEIIFTSGTTAGINLLANSYSFGILKPGDEVIVTQMEHHSNFVPWQEACKRTGAFFQTVSLDEKGDLNLEELYAKMNSRTKLIALTWVSNVTGTVNPVEDIIKKAHEKGIPVLIDAAQAMRHCIVDVGNLDCDYLVFSGHKVTGPTGTGVLYGKQERLEALPPGQFGGGMVDRVNLETTTYDKLPFRLEAGTPNYIGAVGLAGALDFLSKIGMEKIIRREEELTQKCREALSDIPGINILGKPSKQVGAVSFTVDGMHATDVAMLLDSLGIAVRSGHHCAQPLLHHFGLECAVRVSTAFYNTEKEIECLKNALEMIADRFGKGRR